ncbi:DnaJ domain-containing protein, partial [Vibrio parahaemolyticus]
LVLERRVYFKLKKQTGDDFAAKLVRYKKLLQSFAEKDFFQILGISQNAKPSEISRAYLELAKVFHPDKVPRDAPEELKMLCHNIFSHVTQAHLTVSDENNRKAYLVEMSRKEAGRIMEL